MPGEEPRVRPHDALSCEDSGRLCSASGLARGPHFPIIEHTGKELKTGRQDYPVLHLATPVRVL